MEDTEETLEPDFFIKDERYNISYIDKSDLIIEVLPNRFRFSIRNTNTNLIMWLEDYYVDFYDILGNPIKRLKDIIESHQFLSANYWNSIGISFDFGISMLVPSEVFDEVQIPNYLSSYFENTDISSYTFYPFPNNGFVMISGIPKSILNIFNEVYKNKKFDLNSILNGLIIQTQKNNNTLLHFDNRNLHIISFDKEARLKNYEICELLKLDSEENLNTSLIEFDFKDQNLAYISGEITNFSPFYNRILNLIPNLKYAQIKKGIIFSHYFYELPEHRYVGTFSNLIPL